MTTNSNIDNDNNCPAEGLLKMLAGKWKPQIFRMASNGPIRFNTLLREINGTNKQTIATALRELEEVELLTKNTISQKPLHIEYNLSDKGRSLIPVFMQLELLSS